jgi:hypothetical protein
MSVRAHSNSSIRPPVWTSRLEDELGPEPIPKSENRNDSWRRERAGSGPLEEDIEVSPELPLVVAEKYSVLRVARVRMHIQRVEVIGHIEHAKGKAQRIFLVDFHVFGNTRIGGEKLGITKPVAIRDSHIPVLGTFCFPNRR